VEGKLQDMWPGIFVKLDSFHWIKRFDGILFKKNSSKARFFQHLIPPGILPSGAQ